MRSQKSLERRFSGPISRYAPQKLTPDKNILMEKLAHVLDDQMTANMKKPNVEVATK
jgi:hypothetical protein